jgi:hypothetical protein
MSERIAQVGDLWSDLSKRRQSLDHARERLQRLLSAK